MNKFISALHRFFASLTRDKGELERQCDTLNSQAQTNKNRILVLQQNIDDLKQALSRKVSTTTMINECTHCCFAFVPNFEHTRYTHNRAENHAGKHASSYTRISYTGS